MTGEPRYQQRRMRAERGGGEGHGTTVTGPAAPPSGGIVKKPKRNPPTGGKYRVADGRDPPQAGRALVFEDQYISTGGQFYELIVGHDIDIVVDRIVVREGLETRLADSFRTALDHADGHLSRREALRRLGRLGLSTAAAPRRRW